MELRKLRISDAPFMLEWMRDDDVIEFLQAKFKDKTIKDCENFIIEAQEINENCHLAIADDNDEYMGTVSLKNIQNRTAEFAITVRTAAMGKGYSTFGIKEIIKYGFDNLGLKTIYWCVNPVNKRAVRFYDKNGFERFDIVKSEELKYASDYSQKQIEMFLWYKVTKN